MANLNVAQISSKQVAMRKNTRTPTNAHDSMMLHEPIDDPPMSEQKSSPLNLDAPPPKRNQEYHSQSQPRNQN